MSQLGSIRIGPPQPTRRGFSIRAKIVVLLLAPMLPLLTMMLFTISIASAQARSLASSRTTIAAVDDPITAVVAALQAERAASVRYVSEKSADTKAADELSAARKSTDGAIADLGNATSVRSFNNSASAETKSMISALSASLSGLTADRKSIDGGESRYSVMTFYNGILDATFRLYRSASSVDDHTLAGRAATVVALEQAGELWSREYALVLGAATATAVTNRDYAAIVAAVANQRQAYAEASSTLSSADLETYKELRTTSKAKALRAMEDDLTSGPGRAGQPAPVNIDTFGEDFTATFQTFRVFDVKLTIRTLDAMSSAASSRTARVWLVTGVCIVMLVVLMALSWRVARALLRRVAQLRAEALTLALDRLPSVVDRLRSGQAVDVEAEAPPLTTGADELGQLSEAFTRVQHVAVASAVHEATLRQGFNQVFLNIARRSQTLLHRQLALLDSMERRATDPEELEELFRIDHLATRMRRHAEDLVILAGSTPGRGWRSPVPVADVLRAAASEVEEYARISVAVPPNLALVGRAVNDVVHLLAELLENATLFSPPESQVTLSAQVVPNGFAIEVEDRGLGMTPEATGEANTRLAEPPDFDPAHSSRLGLFVVAKLAERQGIRVALRRSPYGGITAVALIPSELIVAPGAVHGDTIEGAVVPNPINGRPAASNRVMALATTASQATGPEHQPAGGHTPDGLPMRVRQASVSRALPDTSEATTEIMTATARSPEQMRSMLSSFQDGMTMGREAATSETARLAPSQPQPAGLNATTTSGSNRHADTTAAAAPAAEASDSPPLLPTRMSRAGRPDAVGSAGPAADHMTTAPIAPRQAPETGTSVTTGRSPEPQSAATESQPPIARGGGDDDN